MTTSKCRVLIVGAGSIGQRHLRCFQQTGRCDVAVCEIDDKLRGQVASQCNVERAYKDIDAALQDTHDAAVICAPAHVHVPLAVKLAEAGLHLLIEKPLSTNLEGVDKLKGLVRERQLAAAVAYVYRANPILADMKRAIDDGRFGQPVQVVATCGQHFPTYRPAYRDIYYTDRSKGGGAIQDALTHVINACEWLVGPIDRLVADADHMVLEGVTVEDTVGVLARHGKVMGCYSLNQHQAPNEMSITVICETATCRFEWHNSRWRWMKEPGGSWHDEMSEPLERDVLFVNQASAFLDVINGAAEPLCTLDQAQQTLRVNLAMLRSADNTNSLGQV